MSERLVLEGRLREKEREAAGIRLRIAGLRDSIRAVLDKYVSEEKINADLAAAQAVELAALRRELSEILCIMDAMKLDLGEK